VATLKTMRARRSFASSSGSGFGIGALQRDVFLDVSLDDFLYVGRQRVPEPQIARRLKPDHMWLVVETYFVTS